MRRGGGSGVEGRQRKRVRQQQPRHTAVDAGREETSVQRESAC